jgi:hypothetical protein
MSEDHANVTKPDAEKHRRKQRSEREPTRPIDANVAAPVNAAAALDVRDPESLERDAPDERGAR